MMLYMGNIIPDDSTLDKMYTVLMGPQRNCYSSKSLVICVFEGDANGDKAPYLQR